MSIDKTAQPAYRQQQIKPVTMMLSCETLAREDGASLSAREDNVASDTAGTDML